MAHGLEARSPFLDTAVVEFGASLPDRLRMRLGKGKLLLRRAMQGHPARRRSWPGARWASARRSGPGSGAISTASCGSGCSIPTSPLYEYLQPEPVAAVVSTTWRGAGGRLSPQIWALLTLESWLRQEKSWGQGVAGFAAAAHPEHRRRR